MSHSLSGSDDSQVVAFHQGVGLAKLKLEVIVLIYIGNGITSHTDICRLRMIYQFLHQLACLTYVAWQINLHAWERAQYCNIVQAVMSSTQLTVCHATAHATDLDWHL